MARRSRNNRSKSNRRPYVGRDPIASIASFAARLAPLPGVQTIQRLARSLEDRRQFHPGTRPARSLKRSDAQLVIRDPIGGVRLNKLAFKVGFKVPSRVALCVRRKERREVLHARGAAGGKVRPPRRNEFSDVRC